MRNKYLRFIFLTGIALVIFLSGGCFSNPTISTDKNKSFTMNDAVKRAVKEFDGQDVRWIYWGRMSYKKYMSIADKGARDPEVLKVKKGFVILMQGSFVNGHSFGPNERVSGGQVLFYTPSNPDIYKAGKLLTAKEYKQLFDEFKKATKLHLFRLTY